jgi:predicted nucleic-acid-binding Zn-ribbon protein
MTYYNCERWWWHIYDSNITVNDGDNTPIHTTTVNDDGDIIQLWMMMTFTVIVCHRCLIIIVHSCIMSSVSSSFTVVLCHRCVITIVHSCSMYRCVITIIHSYINVIDMSSPSFTVVVCHRCVIIVHSCIMSSVSLSSFTVVFCHRCVITIVHSCSMS